MGLGMGFCVTVAYMVNLFCFFATQTPCLVEIGSHSLHVGPLFYRSLQRNFRFARDSLAGVNTLIVIQTRNRCCRNRVVTCWRENK